MKEGGVYECPSCSQPLVFRHNITNLIVCSGCHAPAARLEGDVLVTKPVLIIGFRNDIIQPGTRGLWKNQRFEVLGRIRYWFAENVFNYWTIVFNNGTLGYLAEAYGLYAIYEKVPIGSEVALKELQVLKWNDHALQLNEDVYLLQRREESFKLEVEGEVLIPDTNPAVKIFELSALSGAHMEIFRFSNGMNISYSVEYTDHSSLQLTNTLKGVYNIREVACTTCPNKIIIKTFPYAQSCSCSKCGTGYKLDGNGSPAKNNVNKNAGFEPYIAIGSKGTFKGYEYEVIGCVVKEEKNEYRSQWREYVLHNPENGYAFISEFEGNFVFIRENCNAPVLEDYSVNEFIYNNEPFQLYNWYQFEVVNSRGEFPGNIFNDNSLRVQEFISPPEIWITEKSGEEGTSWYLGEHIDRTEVQQMFSAELPPKESVGAVEPMGFVSYRKLVFVTLGAVLAALVVHFLLTLLMEEKVVIDTSYPLPDTINTVVIISDRFELTKWKSNLKLDISAPVRNMWFQLSGALVNANTGTQYPFEQGIEYYDGYSQGESWHEGGTTGSVYLSSIPAGTYYLQTAAVKERGNSISGFNLTATNDVPVAKNVLIIIVLILIWPLVKFYTVQNNEKKRWSNSSYTPYK